MEQTLLEMLPNLGVGLAAMVVLYLSFKLFAALIEKKDKAFTDYVNANNHKSVEVMTECRDAIKASADNIKEHTDTHKQLITALLKRGIIK